MNIVIYSKNDCPYCDKARALLKNYNKSFNELKLNVDFTREEILELFPNAKTFPIIVVDGSYIGGYSQLTALAENDIRFLGQVQING